MDTSRFSIPGRTALFLALPVMGVLSLPQAAIGQTAGQTTLSKCTDGNRITYSSTSCEEIGLKLAGQIADRLTIIPNSDLLPRAVAASRATVQTAAQVPDAAQTVGQTAAVRGADFPRTSGTQPAVPMIQGLMK